MGVSGSGKTVVGQALARRLGWDFYDADDFHPPQNIAKMAGGIPLTDADRAPWLASLNSGLVAAMAENRPCVLACSALKQQYRQVLQAGLGQVQLVHLVGSYELILGRMQSREGHYMKPDMLQSQIDALEPPAGALSIEITLPVDQIVEKIMETHQKPRMGVIGMGVMGRSIALNLQRHGIPVLGYDPAPKFPDGFPIPLAESVIALTASLSSPRVILIMVPAGPPVEDVLGSLLPALQAGDIVIDGGNSYFVDTEQRQRRLEASGIHFIGMGVSGGEAGALLGPSLMPGGAGPAWGVIQPIFESIAARTPAGQPCVAWMGSGGAGHYVKMVHNGIEYADMQLIAEVYDLLHRGAGLSNATLAEIFADWNKGELRSYLVEITAHILERKEGITDLVDLILDEAAQKGTGKWVSQHAFDVGMPIPTINAAVEARLLSALKVERVSAARRLGGERAFEGEQDELVETARQALYASKVASYAQGFALLGAASQEYGWELDRASIAQVWQAGCIIRAGLLEQVMAAFQRNKDLPNLLVDDYFARQVLACQPAWRKTVQVAVGLGIPMLATTASLAYFDSYRSAVLPANLTQAQRDYFGAHTYRRVDRDGFFHTEWDKSS